MICACHPSHLTDSPNRDLHDSKDRSAPCRKRIEFDVSNWDKIGNPKKVET